MTSAPPSPPPPPADGPGPSPSPASPADSSSAAGSGPPAWKAFTDALADRITMPVVLAGFLLAGLAFTAVPVRNWLLRQNAKDYGRWYDVGVRYLSGQDIYYVEPDAPEGHYEFTYPPPAAAVLAVPAAAGQLGLIVILALVNAVAWPAMLWLTARLLEEPDPRRRAACVLWAGLLTAPMAFETFLLGQPNLVLTALVLGAMVAVASARPAMQRLGGALVGAAAVFKAFPVVFVGWLAWRGRWTAVAAAVGFIAATLLLMPGPGRSLSRNAADLAEWVHGMAASSSAEALVGAKGEKSWHYPNQSAPAVLHRMLRPVGADFADETMRSYLAVNVADLGYANVERIVKGLAVLCAAAYLWRTWAWLPGMSAWPGRDAAMAWLMVLMFSPYSRTYVWVAFVPAVALMLQTVGRRLDAGRRGGWPLANLIAVMVLFCLTPLSYLGTKWPQYWGNTFWATLWMYAAVVALPDEGAADRERFRRPAVASDAG